jgi:hypothetical protein
MKQKHGRLWISLRIDALPQRNVPLSNEGQLRVQSLRRRHAHVRACRRCLHLFDSDFHGLVDQRPQKAVAAWHDPRRLR